MEKRIYKLVAIMLVVALTMFNSPNSVLTLLAATVNGTVVDITTETAENYILTGSGGTALNILDGGVITGQVDMSFGDGVGPSFTVSTGGVLNGNVTVNDAGMPQDNQNIISIANAGTINGDVTLTAGSNITNSGSITSIISNGGLISLEGGSVTNLTVNSGVIIVSGNSTVTNFSTTVGVGAVIDNVTLTVTDSLEVSGTVTGVVFDVMETTYISTDVALEVVCSDTSYVVPAGTEGTVRSLTDYTFSASELVFDDVYVDYKDVETMNVTLTNTGVLPIDIFLPVEFGYFDVVFSKAGVEEVDASRLLAGEVLNIDITLKTGIEIGEYEEPIVLDFGDYEEIIVASITVLDKMTGSGSVTMDDHYYGVTSVIPQLKSDTNGTRNVKVEFKAQGQLDSAYTTTIPKEVGNYTVRATFPTTEKYKQVVATDQFSIVYMPVPEGPTYNSGTKGNEPYYVSDVTVYAKDGYLISETLGGEYSATLTYSASVDSLTLYFKEKVAGGMSAGYTIGGFVIDSNAPTFVNAVNNGEYYGSTYDVNVSDVNLKTVKVNGVEVQVFNGNAVASMTSGNGFRDYTIEASDMAGNTTVMNVRVSAEWMRLGVVPSGIGVRLAPSTAYTLGAGSWSVSGDSTSYVGGNTFYVGSDGDYTFTKE